MASLMRNISLLKNSMRIVPVINSSSLHTSLYKCKTFEPDYLDSAGPEIPVYPPINIQIKGYNFDVLESFQSWIHNMTENMGITVSESWATPAKSYEMTTYLEGGTMAKASFNVSLYERNVQVTELRSVDAPLLLDTIRRALPEGVSLALHEHTVEMAEERWIADPFIDSLRTELAAGQEEKEAEKIKREATAEAKAAKKRELLLKSLTE